jgi:hypothetical protein
VVSLHCFSAGAHYDPSNTGFGPVIGVDEHVVAPGRGFPRHAHRSVVILSWVLEGTLRHESPAEPPLVVAPGDLLVQHAGSRIEHAETNWSDTSQLRFVQTTLLARDEAADGSARTQFCAAPVQLFGATFDVVRPVEPTVLAGPCHLFVASGHAVLEAHELRPGDSARVRDETVAVTGRAELLVVSLDAPLRVDE